MELKPGGSRLDRYGHLLAQVFVVTGGTRLWLQEALIAEGLARVYSFPDNRACVTELLAREAEARASLGVWSSSLYRVVSALDVKRSGRLTHSYQVVEGTVATVGEGGGRIYLNFAKDWHSDFTISVDRKDAPAFAAAGIDLKALAGKRLRVRGFLGWRMADDRSEPSGADRALAGRFQARHAAAAANGAGYRAIGQAVP